MSTVPQIDPADERGKLQREVYVATRINDLLSDEVVSDALNGLLHGLQNAWLDTTNREEREVLWMKGQGLKEFLATLDSLITTGKMAAVQLEQMKNDQSNNEAGE